VCVILSHLVISKLIDVVHQGPPDGFVHTGLHTSKSGTGLTESTSEIEARFTGAEH